MRINSIIEVHLDTMNNNVNALDATGREQIVLRKMYSYKVNVNTTKPLELWVKIISAMT